MKKEQNPTFAQHFDALSQVEAAVLASATVLLIGVGVLGAKLAEMLIRLGLGRLILVDRDGIEAANLYGAFRESEVGQPKAVAVASVCRSIRPEVEVYAFVQDAVDLGLSLFAAADVVCGDVDSLAARELLNERCFQLGKPYIDAGVGWWIGTVRLAHCLCCAWSAADWRNLHRQTPCQPLQPGVPTLTTAYVAAATAALQAHAVVETLHGRAPWNQEWRLDFGGPVFLNSQLPTGNPDCPCDHERLEDPVIDWPFHLSGITLSRLYRQAQEAVGDAEVEVEFESADVAVQWRCGQGHRQERLHFVPASGTLSCPECGQATFPVAWLEGVTPESLEKWGDCEIHLPRGEWLRATGPAGAVWLAPRLDWEERQP